MVRVAYFYIFYGKLLSLDPDTTQTTTYSYVFLVYSTNATDKSYTQINDLTSREIIPSVTNMLSITNVSELEKNLYQKI